MLEPYSDLCHHEIGAGQVRPQVKPTEGVSHVKAVTMRLRLEGNETRDELMDALRHVSASHASAANQHVRKMLLDEADELLDAVRVMDELGAMVDG